MLSHLLPCSRVPPKHSARVLLGNRWEGWTGCGSRKSYFEESSLKSFLSQLLVFLEIAVSVHHQCCEISLCSELGKNRKQMDTNILDWKVVFKPKCFMRIEGGREAETQWKYWSFLPCKVKLLCKETMNPDSHLAGELFQVLKIFQNILTCFWRAWKWSNVEFLWQSI